MSKILFGMLEKIVLFVKLLCIFSQMYAAHTHTKIQWAVAVRILVYVRILRNAHRQIYHWVTLKD